MEDAKDTTALPKTNYSMLQNNGILYRSPDVLSSCVARTYKNEFAQRSSYSQGGTVIFDLNTGSSFVEPSSALLSFEVDVQTNSLADVAVSWGGGLGACSLIQEIRIISKNGVELSRCQNANLLAKVMADWTLSKEGRENAQMCDGFDSSAGGTFQVSAVDGAKLNITIPMKLLSGFFRPTVKGMLIPNGLASGLRIEMSLESPNVAFQAIGQPDDSIFYTINDPQMLLQLSEMNDPTTSALFTESAKVGLEYNFPEYFSTKVFSGTSNKINEALKKAVSQASVAFAVVLDKDETDYEKLTNSGFKSTPSSKVKNFQYRLGQQFYPLQPLSRPSNYWAIASACFGGLRGIEWKPNSVDYDGFNADGQCIECASLDLSDHIDLSGSKINNSSVLELRMELNEPQNSVDVVIFLQFTALVRVSGNRAVLKI
jgi:hypothetical protein